MHVNLLPMPFVLRRRLLRRLYQWGFAFGLIMLLLSAFNMPLLQAYWTAILDLRATKVSAFPVRQLQDERLAITKQSVELEQKLKQLTTVVNQDRSTALLGIVATSVRSAGGGIQVQDMRLVTTAKSDDSQAKARDTQMARQRKTVEVAGSKSFEYQYQLKLRGIGVESESVTAFMESLQKSGVFSKVQLVATQGLVVSGKFVHEFQLECLTHE